MKLHVLLVMASALLCGCTETRFESPLGDNIETCDVRWKGLWTDTEEKSEKTAIYVDNECHFIVADQPENGGPFKRIHVPMNYVHADGKDYLVVADTSLKGIVDVEPPYAIEPAPAKSFYFARYRLRGDNVEITQVNSERAAQLVITGKLEGTVSKTANELHVYIRGDRARMLEIVRKQPIFDEQTPTKLVRHKQTLDEFEQTLLHAPAKQP
jgi:hypothetical protein